MFVNCCEFDRILHIIFPNILIIIFPNLQPSDEIKAVTDEVNTDKKDPKYLDEDVCVVDVERGRGKKAKIGDTVTIFYHNKLEENNNIVGTAPEDGLKFTLGGTGNESVIRGWHIGLIGMRKGGKRNITCPPKTAYGENGLSFFIPPNATIISEVELLLIERKSDQE